jgi:hypothetical protein
MAVIPAYLYPLSAMKQIMLFLDSYSLNIILISLITLLAALSSTWYIARTKTAMNTIFHRFARQLLIASIIMLILGVAGYTITSV